MKKIGNRLGLLIVLILLVYALGGIEDQDSVVEQTAAVNDNQEDNEVVKETEDEEKEEEKDDADNNTGTEVIEEIITETGNAVSSGIQPASCVVAPTWTHQGELKDVSGGSAMGVARFGLDNTTFTLEMAGIQLPALEEGYFYEGWIVRKDPFKFISTGPTEIEGEGAHSNAWTSDEDYSGFTQYILTLEPEDGDPAPAEHILEGELVSIQ